MEKKTYKKSEWTPEKEAKLIELFAITSNENLAKLFDKKENAIRSKAFKMGLKKEKHNYLKKEKQLILDSWAVLSPQEIANLLNKKFGTNRTVWAVINKYRQLTGVGHPLSKSDIEVIAPK